MFRGFFVLLSNKDKLSLIFNTHFMQQSHPVLFNNWGKLGQIIEDGNYSQVFVLVDENTQAFCLPRFQQHLQVEIEVIVISSGEVNKTLDSCQKVWDALADKGADRHSLFINLGGGVIGDLGGFCASTYMRGMDFIQIPTTLLAQVDASVGGKLGIDYKGMKNFIGLIKAPNLVFIDPSFLKTLPKEELRSGYAEVLKHGIIADRAYWDDCKGALPADADTNWTSIIEKSVSIKRVVTESDPNERGLRKILNFGHTIGHAIESIFLESEQPFLHGEAIAIGMVCEAAIADEKGLITEEELKDMADHIIHIYGHYPEAVSETSSIMKLMLKDKKNKGGKIMCSLPEGIGKCVFNFPIFEEDIRQGLDYYAQINK